MQKGELKVIGFFGDENGPVESIGDLCKQHDISLTPVKKTKESGALSSLHEVLKKESGNALYLVLDLDVVLLSTSISEFAEKFERAAQQVIVAASPYFRFDHPGLYYFYWKHFPRHRFFYNYPDTAAFAGRREHLQKMIVAIRNQYGGAFFRSFTLQHQVSRFYADVRNGCFTADVQVALDYQNVLFTGTRLSASSQRKKSWLCELLRYRIEQKLFGDARLSHALKYPVNVLMSKGGYYNKLTKTNPLIISLAADEAGSLAYQNRIKTPLKTFEQLRATKISIRIRLMVLKQLMFIKRVNKGNLKPERIFRFVSNKNSELNQATERIIQRVERQLPVSFAHYNDGELTFIRDYLKKKDHEKWFGRKQQQYSPLLAERLHEAMQFKKEGYFVGVPCSVHHPSLRKLADKIVGDHEYKVQAMTIHHNLAQMPRLLYSLRNRNVYFFTNEYQDLTLFEELGITVEADKVFKVPFRNSYLEYEKYRDMQFPEDAVVVLTCGMLAKILTKTWYEKHGKLSVLALGSSLDDHIQRENIAFRLYPDDLPLTKNLHKSRSFLFGYKKTCRECFCYE